jgi:hypothetical protein
MNDHLIVFQQVYSFGEVAFTLEHVLKQDILPENLL